MTRRAKERRKERVHAKLQQEEEKRLRDERLSARPSWIHLLAAIDGPSSSSLHVSSDSPKPPIVDELQWKSSQVPIAASGGFQLPVKLDARKGELHYSFSTRDYDVNFGVQMICADGNLIELLDTRRYESQKQQVQGQLSLTGPGMVLLLWDNSFSWVNTKQLAYHVELKQETLPVSQAEKTQLALKARLKREQKLLQVEGEFDGLETKVQTEAQTIEFLRHQIEELQLQMRQHEEEKELFNNKKEQVGEAIEELCWELQGTRLWEVA
ncbi:F-box protein [Phytophthora megakarya]|uniref:F-box protein n=1 Tax=Phytophthora megakarya TaxID=4795 RepID=A0A225UHF5_9STRA|nr:F-box protein [Phytophthora megakarya]